MVWKQTVVICLKTLYQEKLLEDSESQNKICLYWQSTGHLLPNRCTAVHVKYSFWRLHVV